MHPTWSHEHTHQSDRHDASLATTESRSGDLLLGLLLVLLRIFQLFALSKDRLTLFISSSLI